MLRSHVGTGRLRDPFIIRDQRGGFHALWTDGWESSSIGCASSTDLIHWENQRLLPVMAHVPGVMNCWAPEAYWDEAAGNYRIIWSSTVLEPGEEKRRDHRIWSVQTADFTSCSAPSVFFDPGYNVIDGTVTELEDRFVMLFKDERGSNEAGTDNKAIRSISWEKSMTALPRDIEPSGLLTPALTEGPTMYRTPNGKWIMLYDAFQDGHYSGICSDDLSAWEPLGARLQLPQGCRHGSVMKLDADIMMR
ncbi:Glycosyl hydrolases family 43 [compost metagenome]